MDSGNMGRTEYHRMVKRIRKAAREALSPGADVLVVSKGDPELLDLGGARGGHFPQGLDGGWSGYHPGSSLEALQHLEELRRRGAEYLLLPKSAYWWLSHYRELASYLEQQCTRLPTASDDCRIYQLGSGNSEMRRDRGSRSSEEAQRAAQLEAFLEALLPVDAKVASVGAPGLFGLRLGGRLVQSLTLPTAGGLRYGDVVDPRLAEILREGVDYVVLPSANGGMDGRERSLVQTLERSSRLVAYRRHLGWLFDVTGDRAPEVRSSRAAARREET